MGHLEAHVVCMNAEIGYGFFITEVIGDFPREEARQFAEYALADAGKSSHLTDDDWHRIYEVSMAAGGGLPLQLLLLILPATNCDEVSKPDKEHQPTVMLKLCHLYCRYAVEMLVSSA